MSDSSGFTAFVPGFDFIKNLGEQASTWGRAASAQPANGGAQAMSGMAAWVAPTFDVEELDKRINDLKSVQFWLEQNARALAATIQALEVQKMTLLPCQSHASQPSRFMAQLANRGWHRQDGISSGPRASTRARGHDAKGSTR